MSTTVETQAAMPAIQPASTESAPARRRLPDWIAPACSAFIAVTFLLLAEVAAKNKWVSPMVMPAPSDVWKVLVSGLSDGYFTSHIVSSVVSLGVGFLGAFVIALTIAGILTSIPFLERVFTPFIFAFQSMPKIAVAPLVVLWLGFGDLSKVTIVTIVCFFPILVNSMQGLKVRDRDHYDLMKSLGASRWQMFFHLRLPHAVPYIFAGVHIGVIFALIGTVVAEFVGTNAGVGYALLQSKSNFDVPGVFACLILLMIMGLALHFVSSWVEKRVSYWVDDVSRVSV